MGALGVDLDEGLEFVRMADHLVDLWDVTVGSIADWALDSGPSRFFAEGWQLESTARVREATAKPIVGVSRLTDPDLMAEIVRSGVWDLIGAARPSIADPFLPRKIDEGRVDEIRECIGCNVCISKADTRRHIGCTQNATAGEEHRRGWHPERFAPAARRTSTRSWSAAGRPAWSARSRSRAAAPRACASSSARRRWAAISRWLTRLPGLAEWGRLTAYRMAALKRLPNVELVNDRELSAAEIAARRRRRASCSRPGRSWAADGLNGFTRAPIPGAEAPAAHILTPEQIVLGGQRPPARPRGRLRRRRLPRGGRAGRAARARGARGRVRDGLRARSRRTAPRRSRTCSCARACTSAASRCAPARC